MSYPTIYCDCDLKPYTTFGISAKAAAIVLYDNQLQLPGIFADGLLPRPFKHIGQGSNLLFTGDFDGTILISHESVTVVPPEHDGVVEISATAGTVMDDLCMDMARRGLWGLENLSGIPGTVGAAAVQNVGAYGVEAGDLITAVDAIEIETGIAARFRRDEMHFGYRDSIFKRPQMRDRYIITRVYFRLSCNPNPRKGYANLASMVGENPTAAEMRDAVIAMRNGKLPDPRTTGSAGSFFKNPVVSEEHFRGICERYENVPHFKVDGGIKIPAAWLIDKSGCKDLAVGGAALWRSQPLVIVNASGSATASDVVALENQIVSRVNENFGIVLHPEVEHLGR